MAVLREGVLHHRGERLLFPPKRNHLAPNGVVGILRIDQADEVRSDVDPEFVRGGEPGPLFVRQLQDPLDLVEVIDPVAELPPPVVPLGVRNVLPARGTPTDSRLAVSTQ